MIACRLRIHGRVQGVWYRAWTVKTAVSLGLVGWVRNRSDGSVEAVVQGDAASVGAMIEACHAGPATAEVSSVAVADLETTAYQNFEQRPTI